MKKVTKYITDNVYNGTATGVIFMFIISFLLMLGIYYSMMVLGNHYGRLCNYSGRFWIDDSKDKSREGDLKGCFTWEEMIEMQRL